MSGSITTGRGSAAPRGRRHGDVIHYLGIRYAGLAAGRRFAEPVPAGRPAVQLTVDRLADVPVFPQLRSRLADALGEAGLENPQQEDAFYLNIWAPEGADGLPVLFFIHGGAWMSGGGSVRWYDGRHLAADGMVVVTVNYRIGPAGHLGPAPVSDTSSAHRPVEDLMLALRWVNENIRQVGGDPDRVTMVGQSAGGWYGHLLSMTPAATGLYRRVAHLSMGTRDPWPAVYLRRIRAAVDKVLTPRTAESAPIDELLRAGLRGLQSTADARPFGYAASGYLPTASGNIPDRMLDPAWAARHCGAEAVYLRYTADETATFFFNSPPERSVTDEQADAWLATLSGDDIPPDWRDNRAAAPADPYERVVAASSWRQFQRLPDSLASAFGAAGIPTVTRKFGQRSASADLLCGHCFDLPFQFGTWDAWSDAPIMKGFDHGLFDQLSHELIGDLAGFVSGTTDAPSPRGES